MESAGAGWRLKRAVRGDGSILLSCAKKKQTIRKKKSMLVFECLQSHPWKCFVELRQKKNRGKKKRYTFVFEHVHRAIRA